MESNQHALPGNEINCDSDSQHFSGIAARAANMYEVKRRYDNCIYNTPLSQPIYSRYSDAYGRP